MPNQLLVTLHSRFKWLAVSLINWHSQTLGASPLYWPRLLPEVLRFLKERYKYQKMASRHSDEPIRTFPILFQKDKLPFDAQYTYQAMWAGQRIKQLMPKYHVDVSSDIRFVTQLSVWVPVVYIEYRTTHVSCSNLHFLQGSIVELPFASNSVGSISCLHVIEHIGLGRYGDPLDVCGSRKALDELQRVIAPRGSLLVSVPIGRPRTLFNAHRIFAPDYLLGVMASLKPKFRTLKIG